jgi:hypothetical protein
MEDTALPDDKWGGVTRHTTGRLGDAQKGRDPTMGAMKLRQSWGTHYVVC